MIEAVAKAVRIQANIQRAQHMIKVTNDKKTKHLPPETSKLYPTFTSSRQPGVISYQRRTRLIVFPDPQLQHIDTTPPISQKGNIEGRNRSMVLSYPKIYDKQDGCNRNSSCQRRSKRTTLSNYKIMENAPCVPSNYLIPNPSNRKDDDGSLEICAIRSGKGSKYLPCSNILLQQLHQSTPSR